MSDSLKVPKAMQPIFIAVCQLIDDFCNEHLNEEYSRTSQELAATLCRKRPSPLLKGKPEQWAEEKIPVLGNKTPLRAVRTTKGRQAVIELLQSYEHHEARRVRDQGGQTFDFGFLWDRLGLKRDMA